MENPWKEIPLADYEAHMRSETVLQLQALNAIMKDQFSQSPAKTVLMLGIAGGNGVEHVDWNRTEQVIGVDINPEYIQQCACRYPNLQGRLSLLCLDVTDETAIKLLPTAQLVLADLIIEYLGYSRFQDVIQWTSPETVSCVIQGGQGEDFVSCSPYLHAFDDLARVHCQIEKQPLIEAMKQIGYQAVCSSMEEKILPNGKTLIRLDFKNTAKGSRKSILGSYRRIIQ